MASDHIINSKDFNPGQYFEESAPQYLIKQGAESLAGFFQDKGFASSAINQLGYGEIAGALISKYFIGEYTPLDSAEQNDAITRAAQLAVTAACEMMPDVSPLYTGSPSENALLIKTPHMGLRNDYVRRIRGFGAQRVFYSGLVELSCANPELCLQDVPIAIVGAGAAGTLSARALMEIGFNNVHVYDQQGRIGGIWNQPNVHQLSKNNPVQLVYDTIIDESAALLMHPEGSGRSILQYIQRIGEGSASALNTVHTGGPINPRGARVTGIEPGDLQHTLHIDNGGKEQLETYPIVVLAPGIGEPRPLSHDEHMTTTGDRIKGVVRWQQYLETEKLEELSRQYIIFVGLGNSTLEMVHQLQHAGNIHGLAFNYSILTHFSNEQLLHPGSYIGKERPVFRDVGLPELTRAAGDLLHVRQAYEKAYDEHRIIGNVRRWERNGNQLTVTIGGGEQHTRPVDTMYGLIGYRQKPKMLAAMGITCIDSYDGGGAYDFDGEVQRKLDITGRERLYPGYYVVGPPMKSTDYLNAEVIPGIQGQLNDLLTGIVIRAVEYAMTRR